MLDRLQVERVVELDLQSLRPCLDKVGDALDCAYGDVGGALDLARVTAYSGAPLVDDLVLVSEDIRRTRGVRHVGVLCHQPQRHLLAAAADQHRQRTNRRGVELAQTHFDPLQRSAQVF